MNKNAEASRQVSLGLIQMSCSKHPEENLAKAIERIRLAAQQGAQIVCLQELFRSLYFCQSENTDSFRLAEPIPGPTTDALRQVAADLKIVLVASLFERRAEGLFHNTAVVIDADGSLAGKYRKMHIPDDPLYYEKFYFTPGDLGFQTFHTRYAKIGVLVCWDQWFPEGARLTALSGAQILFYPTAIGWHHAEIAEERQAQHQAWELIQRSHAVANGVYVAAAESGWHGRRITILGRVFRQRSLRSPGCVRESHRRRNPGGVMRPRSSRHRSAELAVPPRPTHRCVR